MVKKNGLTVNWGIMKKLFYLAAVAAAFIFASCTKAEPESAVETVKKYPTIDIAVGNFEGKVDDGVTTRAVKTGWVAGDKINIWFDGGTYKYGTDFPSKDEHFYPELIMTYNGSTWDYEFSSFFDKTLLKTATSGKLRAVFESRNDIRKTFYQPSKTAGELLYANYTTLISYANYYTTPMIVYAYSSYTYDSDADKISASVSSWQFMTKIQVYITGLTKDESYYTLVCEDDKDNPDANGRFSRIQGIRLASDGVVYPYGENASFGVGGGTMGADGMAFYFSDAVSPGVAKNYKFRLGYFMGGKQWAYGYAQFDNKVITTSPTTLKCIKIDKSQFSNSSLIK